ncbi:MAG: Zn-dependent hydrolase [Cyanobacteriota bacterium]
MDTNLRVNAKRLSNKISELAKIGALPGGGVSRLALTFDDQQGRNLVLNWMKELGLSITIDGIGNVVATKKGKYNMPPVMMGSHIDTVTVAGPYDGCLGVLAGLEVIETLNELNIETDMPLAVAFFTNEEGSRFQPDMMGSLVYTGELPLKKALATFGIYKSNVEDSLNRIGYNGSAPCGTPNVAAFFELHIEQGPVLEREGYTIGVVESVQGISWTEITLEGKSCHAGYYPMDLRNDAGFVCGQITQYARIIAKEIGGNQVATVGHIEYHPNLVNVAPDKVVMTVDMRNPNEEELQEAENKLDSYLVKVCRDEGIKLSTKKLARFQPTFFNKEKVNLVEEKAKELGYKSRRLHSTAGHDAQILSKVCPTAMIFIPCVDGISHNINEYAYEQDIEAGANVLLNVVLESAKVKSSDLQEMSV